MRHPLIWVATLFLAYFAFPACAPSQYFIDKGLFQGMEWRNIGPYRGGRCVAVAGLPSDPFTFYMGTTGGGVWKTEDGGLNWFNISDGYFQTGTVGAIAIAPSDPNILYVGMGEHPVRGVMSSSGDGVYKSLDGGKTWQHLGLADTRHIASVQVHPQNPNIVYVAAQGAAFGPSESRGVYRSLDGGISWQKVLYVDNTTGACDLSMDQQNPRILYAGLWDYQRYPWTARSGGPGSGLYKSMDGGLNWEKLTIGLPAAMGKVGICVSPANPDRVYANIEAENGGVFRSDDGGKSWVQTNSQRLTVARAWYYIEIVADPIDEETVYILNAPLLKSTDGGKTFYNIPNPHSDQHALWINPNQPDIMILGNDGGASITFNGGKSWSSQGNQPTAQFYRVITDNRFPYYVYGGQQDNSTIAIPSRTPHAGIGAQDWYPVAGGESAFIALDPNDPTLVYGGSYQGELSVYDHRTGMVKDIMAYPTLSLGKAPRDMKYRFNWNAPLAVQPQDPSVLYHAANVVLRSDDEGLSWQPISPDLTRNDPNKQGPGGGPYTNEGAGGENYNTISYLACSPHQAGLIWVGSDDGLVHLTRDEGKHWDNVTPPGLEECLINCIEVSPHDPGSAYVVATRYKFNDLSPLAFFTKDYGKTWRQITAGIDKEAFLRVIREDPVRPGLLYGGTEAGFFISFNYGQQWERLQLNLPVCPINDLTVHGNSLVAATSGRSFWILDGLEPLQQSGGQLGDAPILFQPQPAVRYSTATPEEPESLHGMGQNPPDGACLYYYLPESLDSAVLELQILDRFGNLVRSYSNQPEQAFEKYEGGPKPKPLLPSEIGINRFYWDFRREGLPGIPGVFVMGSYEGGQVAPGEYQLRLLHPQATLTQTFTVLPDPRLEASPEDFSAQQEILSRIELTVKDIHHAVQQMRDVRQQLENLRATLKKIECTQELINASESIVGHIDRWEENLIQPRQQTYQDVINFPNQLSAELLNLMQKVDSHDPRITEGAKESLAALLGQWSQYKTQMRHIIDEDLSAFNRLYREQQVPAVILPLGGE
ncbi:MAG: glycosyl hydrolase [Phaeodactylibacter sp.]|nr:glycosyl hydrolase [Phaeodactylibacter sp.]